MSDKKITVAIIGAGGRGLNAHGQFIAGHPELNVEVVAVADPKPDRLELARRMFPNLNDEMVFTDFQTLLDRGKIADAVVIATMEDTHAPIAVACAQMGCHILLEKPMAPTAEACRLIVNEAKKAGVIFAVCHVLRYSQYYQKIRSLIAKGTLGDIAHIQHNEEISYWHYTHSFVRGHNCNSDRTSFALLSKSCHDVDIIRYLLGKRCQTVQSFGGLLHFCKSGKPAKAGDAVRCTECPHEPSCPFSAMKIYVRKGVNIGADAMPGESISRKLSDEELMVALKTGRFGRCVYECDNNVVDHQVVNFAYEGGATAAFTLGAFTDGDRKTIVQGSKGMIRGSLATGQIQRYDFLTDTWHDESPDDPTARGGHGGGDRGLMSQWIEAIRSGDQYKIITGPDETLETHLTAFAAEQSRLDGQVKTVEY